MFQRGGPVSICREAVNPMIPECNLGGYTSKSNSLKRKHTIKILINEVCNFKRIWIFSESHKLTHASANQVQGPGRMKVRSMESQFANILFDLWCVLTTASRVKSVETTYPYGELGSSPLVQRKVLRTSFLWDNWNDTFVNAPTVYCNSCLFL